MRTNWFVELAIILTAGAFLFLVIYFVMVILRALGVPL